MGALYANLLIDAFLILFPALYIKHKEKKRFRAVDFGLQANGKGWLGGVFLTGKIFAALLATSLVLSLTLSITGLDDLALVEDSVRSLAASPFWMLLYLALVRVFAEEFFFRAFLVPRTGVLAASVVFGISHATYGSIAEVLGAIVLGWVLGHFYAKERKLLPNYVAHLLYNAMAFATFLSA